jgi:hypothetical protein
MRQRARTTIHPRWPRFPIILAVSLWIGGLAQASTFDVAAGSAVQAAIDAAADGDTVSVGPGTFVENIDFLGKAITVVGAGPQTVLQGTGVGSVVTFSAGESLDSVLAALTITGGSAERGGGIVIVDSSPTIVRTVITDNRAMRQGSGVYIEGEASPRLYNNLITYNGFSGGSGDPHAVDIVRAAPRLVNNTIVRGDSNGINVQPGAAPTIMNNVIALNGSVVNGAPRGRGICDFSTRAVIRNNAFYKNRVSAILRNGTDWRKIRKLQRRVEDALLGGNVDGNPGFIRRPRPQVNKARVRHFELRKRARGTGRGNPETRCNNTDGTRNTIGFTGGPFAGDAVTIPDAGSCGG